MTRTIPALVIAAAAMVAAQIGAAEAAYAVYDSPSLGTRLRSFAAACKREHPKAKAKVRELAAELCAAAQEQKEQGK